MAEGGDEVDAGKKIICNICEEGGQSVKADQFCVSCEQYLCEECKQYHSRVRATKSHQVIGNDEIPSWTSLTLGSDAIETPLCKDHEQKLTYFCVGHMTELCQSCRLMDHKNCVQVIEFDKALYDVFSEGHSKNILKSMKDIVDNFSKCKSIAQSNRDKLFKSKQSAIENVKQARKIIESHLDKIEAADHAEIDRICKIEMKRVEDILHVCDVSIYQLQKRITKLERAMTLNDKESEFVAINNVSKEIKGQCTLLKDTIEDTCDTDFTFIMNDGISEITKIMPSFGTVSMTKTPAIQPDIGTIAIFTDELKPITTSDTKVPAITSYEMLPYGRQLITDQANKKLKMYDSNNQILSELIFSDIPWDVVLLSDTEAVVALPLPKSLQYITIGTILTLSETKNVNYQPSAMVKYGADILATVRGERFYKVVVINNHGTLKRTIYQDNGSLFSLPYYMGLSVDQKTVYVLDQKKGCIALSMDGNIEFQYKGQKNTTFIGLAVDKSSLFMGVPVEEIRCAFDDI